MRFFLLIFCFIIFTPSAFAAVSGDSYAALYEKNCSLSGPGDPKVADELEVNYTLNEEGIDTSAAGRCGKIEENGSLQPGDCTAGGLTLTEIVEPIGGAVSLSEDEYIVNVYKGLCCDKAIYDPVDQTKITACETTREVYKLTSEACNEEAAFCEKRQWIIAASGAGIVKVFVKQIYIYGAGIVGFIAVVVIVVSGIQISVSGVSGDITSAKERIWQSISGLVLLFLSGLILYTINPTFFS